MAFRSFSLLIEYHPGRKKPLINRQAAFHFDQLRLICQREITLLELAPHGDPPVAGLHGASPSATLDKVFNSLAVYPNLADSSRSIFPVIFETLFLRILSPHEKQLCAVAKEKPD